ncbi:unnamed protein product [Leptidea sinapis]|uniref:Uncharacterized protein n=1 Tax=Leptidea sinapis TaxID=189913 RepID=A0A5E4QQV7_9NEOP|nr:unnamed protein product [Leptidea sinapis]
MEVKLQKQIIDHFSFLEEFYNTSKTCLKSCQNYAVSIYKIARSCRNIKEAQLQNTPLENFDGLQNRLIASLHSKINNLIQEIQSEFSIIEETFEKLCYKNKLVQDSCIDIDFTEESDLIKGSPYQPPLKQLLEFASDSVTFGSHICAQIETALNILALEELETISFPDHFKFPTIWETRIPEIIAYTSFIQENTI